jgi:hypothetical protein
VSSPLPMAKLKRILLIIFGSLAGLYLFIIFILISFPYEALIERLDQTLRTTHGLGISVERVAYRYPMKLNLQAVQVVQEGRLLVVSIDDLSVRFGLFTPAKFKSVEMRGTGIEIRSEWIELSKGSASLEAKLRPLPLIRGKEGNHIQSVQFIAGSADVQRVRVSGFEFPDLRLRQVQIFLRGQGEGFTVERGLLAADVMRAELEGSLGLRSLDLLVRVALTDDFYRKFGNLRQIVDAVFRNGSLQVRLAGTLQDPQFRIVQ